MRIHVNGDVIHIIDIVIIVYCHHPWPPHHPFQIREEPAKISFLLVIFFYFPVALSNTRCDTADKSAVTRWHGLDTWGAFGNIIPSFQVALSNTRCEWHFWQECDDYVAWIGHWIGSKKSGDTVAWIGFSKKGGASPNIFPSTLWCCHLHRRVISATKHHKRVKLPWHHKSQY